MKFIKYFTISLFSILSMPPAFGAGCTYKCAYSLVYHFMEYDYAACNYDKIPVCEGNNDCGMSLWNYAYEAVADDCAQTRENPIIFVRCSCSEHPF